MATTSTQISIFEVTHALGIQLVDSRDRLIGTCPLHGGEGFQVDPKSNTWSCSECGIEGGVGELVQKTQGVTRRHALELLKVTPLRLAPPSKQGPRKGDIPEVTTRRFLASDLDPDDDDQTLLAKVVDFYNKTLITNEEVLAYLDKRGLADKRLIDRFQLGVANRTLGYRLPRANRRGGAAIRSRLQELGVLRPSGHEHLSGSLVVPVVDRGGDILQLYGRKIGERLRQGTALHLWLPGKPRATFNKTAMDSDEVIITDSILNALTFLAHGFEHAVGLSGVDADADDLVSAVSDSGIKKVVIALRRTGDGDNAAANLAKLFAAIEVEVHRLAFPAGMDANDFACSTDNPREAFSTLLRCTEWVGGRPAKLNTRAVTTPAVTCPVIPTSPTMPVVGSKDNDDELVLAFEDRRWRVRGVVENKARGTLRLNLFVSREGAGFHVDRFDLYSARHRSAFTKLAAVEVGADEALIKKDLGAVLLAAEQAQDELLLRHREPEPTQVELTPEDRGEALQFLQDPKLLDRVLDDFEKVGVVGERDNLLVAFLVTISRKLSRPLAALVQSSSAAGKSSLLTAVLDFVPEEDRVIYSAMTGQSLYYVGANDLRHKVLSIAEEQGAERAAYSLKLLQSDGALTIASTGKETGTGRLVSHEYRVHGPLALMMTTTKVQLDTELLNRCLVIAVDESPEQTRRIQERQRWRQTLEGMLAAAGREGIYRLHQNAQRLLRPISVVNPLASTMSYSDHRVRARRDHQKLLSFIETLALLHQHQRQFKTVEVDGGVVEYVEVEPADIEIAERLMMQVGTVGPDDLPPHTKRVLQLLDDMVAEMAKDTSTARSEIRFSRRQGREHLGIGDTQLWVHMRRLVAAEYLLVHPSRGRGVVYELAFCGCTTHDIRDRSGQIRGKSGQDSAQVRPPDSEERTGKRSTKRAARVTKPKKRKQGPSQKPRTVRSTRPKKGRS